LKRTLDLLPLIRQTLNPESTVSYACQLMRDMGVSSLPVEGDRPLVVHASEACLAKGLLVKECAEEAPILASDSEIKEAATFLTQAKRDAGWVVKNGQFAGLVTIRGLLDELATSRDPMTGLTWSDHLREWGQERLAEGRELTLLFIDLDRFGAYNKNYGHIFGDRVLQRVAQVLLAHKDPQKDIVVRYGGDEFVLASTRDRVELEELRSVLSMQNLAVEGIEERITFSIGMAGGNRGRERTTVHLAATLDNLINLASRDALARKPRHSEEPALILHPSEALFLALEDFRISHPEKASQIADVQYQVVPDRGLVVSLLGESGQRLSSAPLGQDLRASLKNALASFAQAV